jgi:phage replication-related protein YjqB (UPF0714/DUF867 family)
MSASGRGLQAVDRYRSYAELRRDTLEDRDYRVITRAGSTGIAIMAPHGGRIEPGTDLIADAVAGREHAFYAFMGLRLRHNAALHIASERFDEPRAIEMAVRSHTVITIHGCRSVKPVIYVGGLDEVLKFEMIAGLCRVGFAAGESPLARLKGTHPRNLCNLGLRGKGVQLEVAGQLRRKWVRSGEQGCGPYRTPLFAHFVKALRDALGQCPQPHLEGESFSIS